MELGAFCAWAPVQRQLGLFLLEATCCELQAVATGSAGTHCCGMDTAQPGVGALAPSSVPGQAGAAWAVLSLPSFGAAFLCPGLRLEPGLLGGVG